MRAPAFSKLSVSVLESYKKDIEKELAARSNVDKKRDKVRAKIVKILKAEGMTLSDLTDGKAAPAKRKVAAKPRAKVAPKYRNPKNKAEMWTGRGRQPLWVAAHVKSGGKLEQLLIKK